MLFIESVSNFNIVPDWHESSQEEKGTWGRKPHKYLLVTTWYINKWEARSTAMEKRNAQKIQNKNNKNEIWGSYQLSLGFGCLKHLICIAHRVSWWLSILF